MAKTKQVKTEILDRSTFNKGIDLIVDGKYPNLPSSLRDQIKNYIKNADLEKINLGLQLQIKVRDNFALNRMLSHREQPSAKKEKKELDRQR